MMPTLTFFLIYGAALIVWLVFAVLALRNALTARRIGARILPFMVIFILATVSLITLSIYHGLQGQGRISSPGNTKAEVKYN